MQSKARRGRPDWGSQAAVITVLGLWTESSYTPHLGRHNHCSGSLRHPKGMAAPHISQQPSALAGSGQSSALSQSQDQQCLQKHRAQGSPAEATPREIEGGLHHKP